MVNAIRSAGSGLLWIYSGVPPIGHQTGLENPQWGQGAGYMTFGTFSGELGSSTSKSLITVLASAILMHFKLPAFLPLGYEPRMQSTETPCLS